ALAVNADGVHLGQDDLPPTAARAALGPGKILGVSTHSLEQAIRAAEEGADYLGIGPIFPTATKPTGYAAVGCDMIRRILVRINLPLVAIGGITLRLAQPESPWSRRSSPPMMSGMPREPS
ncbi:MAG: thiE, partial [candidate division NC10 bacterium]|nr:thiE [candidate division NC10 bacterium]